MLDRDFRQPASGGDQAPSAEVASKQGPSYAVDRESDEPSNLSTATAENVGALDRMDKRTLQKKARSNVVAFDGPGRTTFAFDEPEGAFARFRGWLGHATR